MTEPTGRAKGGLARAAKLTPERRSEIASHAVAARWGKDNAAQLVKGRTPKSKVYGIRLDSMTKYLAEIAARNQHRSLANFIEYALIRALDSVDLGDGTVWSEQQKLWDIDEHDRLRKLAKHYPELLTFEEKELLQNNDEGVE
jgi:hypothetical protein